MIYAHNLLYLSQAQQVNMELIQRWLKLLNSFKIMVVAQTMREMYLHISHTHSVYTDKETQNEENLIPSENTKDKSVEWDIQR